MNVIEHIKTQGVRELDRFYPPGERHRAIELLEEQILAIQGQLDFHGKYEDPDWWRRAISVIRLYKLALKRLNKVEASEVTPNHESRLRLKRSVTDWQRFSKSLADQLEDLGVEVDASLFPEIKLNYDEWMDEMNDREDSNE